MFHGVPMGYVLLGQRAMEKRLEMQARGPIARLSETFWPVGSLSGLFLTLVRDTYGSAYRRAPGAGEAQPIGPRPPGAPLAEAPPPPIYSRLYLQGGRAVYPEGPSPATRPTTGWGRPGR